MLQPRLFTGFLDKSVGKEPAGKAGDPSSIPRLGRSPGKGIDYPLQYSWASLWLTWQIISLQCGRLRFNPWVVKMLWRRKGLPTPVFWPGEFHGLCSLWGRKESVTTERISHSLFPSVVGTTVSNLLYSFQGNTVFLRNYS